SFSFLQVVFRGSVSGRAGVPPAGQAASRRLPRERRRDACGPAGEDAGAPLQNTLDTEPATTGNAGDVTPSTVTRYSPGASPSTPKKPLPSVVVVRVAFVASDSTVTTAPSRAA